MAQSLLAVGSLAALMGAAVIPPVVVARLESGGLTALGLAIVSVGCGLIVCGAIAVLIGFRQRVASRMPSGVRIAITANILFLAFLALELSDRLIRRDGNLVYWTTFLFPPTLVLFCGLVAGRNWSWWVARGAAALGVLWFLAFLVVVPFATLQSEGMPIPWYGRVYMASVTLAFAVIMVGAFWSLGRPETRNYFGLVRTEDRATI